jgi:mRNA interferase MazF
MNSRDRPYCPDANDIIRINFDPHVGREQAGMRPAIVLSPRRYNSLIKLCVVCPITNQSKGYPFEVAIPRGYAVTGVILADHVKSVSWDQRGSVFICVSPPGLLREVAARIHSLIIIP